MNIYFAGSIRGGREKEALYAACIQYISKYGNVLTEHVGDASIGNKGEQHLSDKAIYTRDVQWIRDCDVVVADVSIPSLGVGYEIGYAESLKKPVLCLYDTSSERKLSAMISGNEYCTVVSYTSLDDIERALSHFFSNCSITDIPLDRQHRTV